MRNIILLASILFLASACTTIMSGKTQEMTFDSEPQGVEVNVSGKVIGRTPTTVQLDKKKDQTLTFSLEGYKTQTRNLATTVDPWFFGNVIFGGLIGSTTDAITGSIHKYAPNQYYVTMVKKTGYATNTYSSKKAEVKEFIVMGYTNIMNDLSKSGGQYLDSLIEMLQIEKSKRNDSISKIRSLSEVYTKIPEFADKVTELFLKE